MDAAEDVPEEAAAANLQLSNLDLAEQTTTSPNTSQSVPANAVSATMSLIDISGSPDILQDSARSVDFDLSQLARGVRQSLDGRTEEIVKTPTVKTPTATPQKSNASTDTVGDDNVTGSAPFGSEQSSSGSLKDSQSLLVNTPSAVSRIKPDESMLSYSAALRSQKFALLSETVAESPNITIGVREFLRLERLFEEQESKNRQQQKPEVSKSFCEPAANAAPATQENEELSAAATIEPVANLSQSITKLACGNEPVEVSTGDTHQDEFKMDADADEAVNTTYRADQSQHGICIDEQQQVTTNLGDSMRNNESNCNDGATAPQNVTIQGSEQMQIDEDLKLAANVAARLAAGDDERVEEKREEVINSGSEDDSDSDSEYASARNSDIFDDDLESTSVAKWLHVTKFERTTAANTSAGKSAESATGKNNNSGRQIRDSARRTQNASASQTPFGARRDQNATNFSFGLNIDSPSNRQAIATQPPAKKQSLSEAAYAQQIEELNSQVSVLKSEIESLTQQLDLATRNAELHAAEKEQIEKLTAQLADKQNQCDEQVSIVQSLTDKLNEAIRQAEATQADKDRVEASLNDQLVSLKSQFDAKSAQVESLTERLSEANSNAELNAAEKEQALYTQLAARQSQIDTQVELIQSLNDKLNEALRSVESSVADRAQIEVQVAQLQADHRESVQRYDGLLESVRDREQEIRRIENELKEEREITDTLRKQIEQLNLDRSTERDELLAKVEQLSADLAKSNASLSSLNEQLTLASSEGNEQQSHVVALNTRLAALEMELQDLRDREVASSSLSQERAERIVQLESQLATLGEQLTERESAIASLTAQNTELAHAAVEQQVVAQKLREELDAATSQTKDNEHREAELKTANLALNEQLASLKSEFERSANEQLAAVQQANETLSAKLELLEDANSKLAAAEIRETELRAEFAIMGEKIEAINSRNAELEAEILVARDASASQNLAIAAKDGRIAQLEAERDELERRINLETGGLQEQLASLQSAYEMEKTQRAELEAERCSRMAQQISLVETMKQDATRISDRFANVFESPVEVPQVDLNANETIDVYASRLLKFIEEQLVDKEDIYAEKNRVSRLCDDADEDLCRMQCELRKAMDSCAQKEAELNKMKICTQQVL